MGGSQLVGEYSHQIDAKGRVILPAKLRDDLGGPGTNLVLQKGIDRCVYVYPPAEWDKQVEKVNSLATTDPNARRFARFFFSQASREQLDRQGRLPIPQSIRQYAGLEREVMVVGAGGRVEIWDRETWVRHLAENEASIEDISRQLGI